MEVSQLQQGFRELLRSRRLDMGMTQSQLAIKIAAHQSYVAALESGERSPTLATLAKLSEALDISPQELLPK